MNRRIITEGEVKLGEAQTGEKDDYLSRILKLIPAEVVAGFLFIDGSIRTASDIPMFVSWLVFSVLTILTAWYIWQQTSKPFKETAIRQILLSTIAFGVWVFAIGGPFTSLSWYKPLYGDVLLVVFTLMSGQLVLGPKQPTPA